MIQVCVIESLCHIYLIIKKGSSITWCVIGDGSVLYFYLLILV